ncbi:hypothetical protein FN846DRAFT_890268 [Sphaerosporella brunnea]|uniref:Uncharacterized protein n=1 Tax=Sphaerosporella brunnea TaxID=1250544 RepID=A0A5J5EWJ0_9PEZI|nr:hypothetical protein FN846DRAFT_890268 [Sphaerosporella brunnea]
MVKVPMFAGRFIRGTWHRGVGKKSNRDVLARREKAAARKLAADRQAVDQEVSAAEIRTATVEVEIALSRRNIVKQNVETAKVKAETAEVKLEAAKLRLTRLNWLSQQAVARRYGAAGPALACPGTTPTAAADVSSAVRPPAPGSHTSRRDGEEIHTERAALEAATLGLGTARSRLNVAKLHVELAKSMSIQGGSVSLPLDKNYNTKRNAQAADISVEAAMYKFARLELLSDQAVAARFGPAGSAADCPGTTVTTSANVSPAVGSAADANARADIRPGSGCDALRCWSINRTGPDQVSIFLLDVKFQFNLFHQC